MQWLNTLKGFELDSTISVYDEGIFSTACKGGHLETVKWLRSQGCSLDADECSGAAEGGHLEILKWLRSEGCPWDERACTSAAIHGHLDVLQWAIDNGCPYEVNETFSGEITRTALGSLGFA